MILQSFFKTSLYFTNIRIYLYNVFEYKTLKYLKKVKIWRMQKEIRGRRIISMQFNKPSVITDGND
jgi:hypothetical protein